MRTPSRPRPVARLAAVATAAVTIAVAGTARADGELCVVCEGPTAVYRCLADGGDPAARVASGLPIRCVTEIARRGPHERCRIDKTRSVATCTGLIVTVTPPPPPLATPVVDAPPVAPSPPAPPPTAEGTPPAAKPDKPPETVAALATQAAKTSTETVKETSAAASRQIENAGSAVGSALRKSWECVSSLFSRC
jgi:hypothetical protein